MNLPVNQKTKSSTLTPLIRVCHGDLLLFISFLCLTFWENIESHWRDASFWLESASQVSGPFFIGVGLAGLVVLTGQNRLPQLQTRMGDPPIIPDQAGPLNGTSFFFPLRIVNACIWSFLTIFFFNLIACKEVNHAAFPALHPFCQSVGQNISHGLIGLALGYILWLLSYAYKIEKIRSAPIHLETPCHPETFFQNPLLKLVLISLSLLVTFEVVFLALRLNQ